MGFRGRGDAPTATLILAGRASASELRRWQGGEEGAALAVGYATPPESPLGDTGAERCRTRF